MKKIRAFYEKYKPALKVFGLFFFSCFLVGAFNAYQDNRKGPSDAEVYNYISGNMRFRLIDSANSFMDFHCKDALAFRIRFDDLAVKKNPAISYEDPIYNLGFIPFDRMATIVGATALSVYTAKDFVSEFKSVSKNGGNVKIYAAVAGILSGYSLGYYVFKEDISCSTTKVERFFDEKNNINRIKTYAITQILNSKFVRAVNVDSTREHNLFLSNYEVLDKLTKRDTLNVLRKFRLSDFVTIEINYLKSYNKMWSNLDSVTTADIYHVVTRVQFWEDILSNPKNIDYRYNAKLETLADIVRRNSDIQ